jgi:opacity protein-like surface antigen
VTRRLLLMGVVAATAALLGEPAQAQISSQEVQVTAGYMFGDHFTQTLLPGSQLRLDDGATVGARYTYYFTDNWGIQVSGGCSPGHAAHVPSGANHRSLATTDFDLEFDLAPGFELGSRALIPYTVLGVGYAWAHQDDPVYGFAGSRPADMDRDGYTANIGLGAKYYVGKNVFVGFDARYRYLSRPAGGFGQSLNTEETSLILGYRF